MSHVREKKRIASSAGVAALLVAAITLVSSGAQAQELGERRTMENNSGPGVSVRPSAYFPSRGNTGLAVDANATYGIPAAPLVIAPGARFAGYLGDQGAISGMPIVEVMLPIGAVVPYAKAGAGVGHATGPKETGLALMGGGGVDVHVTRDVLVGVDATYETISGTGFNTTAVGPRASVRY